MICEPLAATTSILGCPYANGLRLMTGNPGYDKFFQKSCRIGVSAGKSGYDDKRRNQ